MKLRRQFFLIVGIPLLGMVIVFAVGLKSFSSIRTKIRNVTAIQNDLSTMINADRDAYQAFLTENKAVKTMETAELEKLDADNQENLKQTLERISGPAKYFTADMQGELSRFQSNYEQWARHSRKIISLSKETALENQQMQQSSAKAIEAFNTMRDNIDKLGELINSQLEQSVAPARRRQLEKALSLVLNGDRDSYQAYLAQLMAIRSRNHEDMKKYNQSNIENITQTGERFLKAAQISGQQADGYKADFQQYYAVWKEQSRKAVDIARQSLTKNLQKVAESKSSSEVFGEMRDAIDKLENLQDKRSGKGQAEMMQTISSTITIYLVTVIVALLLAMGIAYLIVRSLLVAVFQCVDVAEKIGNGNFDVSMEGQRKDELGNLMSAMNQMAGILKGAVSSISRTMDQVSKGDFTERVEDTGMTGELVEIKNSINKSIDMLSDTISQVVLTSEQVNSGSEQIASASQSLASGTTEQAASIEEISSTMSEIGSRANSNNDNSEQAAKLASQTMDIARNGTEQMQDTLSSMDKINASSDDISKIIKVIDEIAFQTNLLALNAAVEAARAGKYGKGFAVVAEEVRNLAARSAEAAKNTTELIENSVKEAESGVVSTRKTAEILSEINDGIVKVNDLVGEISAASREQSSSISEINTSLNQVNEVIQRNSSISEESASASEELSSQSTELQSMMSRFRLLKAETVPLQASAPEEHKMTAVDQQEEIPPKSRRMITLDDDDFGKY